MFSSFPLFLIDSLCLFFISISARVISKTQYSIKLKSVLSEVTNHSFFMNKVDGIISKDRAWAVLSRLCFGRFFLFISFFFFAPVARNKESKIIKLTTMNKW